MEGTAPPSPCTEEPVVATIDCGLHKAEEATEGVLDAILTGGGHALYRRYLDRKAFSMASACAGEAAVSQLNMCFVQHEGSDDAQDWCIEQEPPQSNIDSWGCMCVPIEKKVREPSGFTRHATMRASKSRRAPPRRRPSLDSINSIGSESGSKKSSRRGTHSAIGDRRRIDPRAFQIAEEFATDEAEDELRLLKTKKDALRRKQESIEKERRMMEHEDQTRKEREAQEESQRPPCNVDDLGHVVWAEEQRPELLPEAITVCEHSLRRRPNTQSKPGSKDRRLPSRGVPERPSSSPASSKAGSRGTLARQKAGPLRPDKKSGFTDGCCRAEYMQPPISETMSVQPGVTLECWGIRRAQVQESRKCMTRREYCALVDEEAERIAKEHGRRPAESRPDTPSPGDLGTKSANVEANLVTGEKPPATKAADEHAAGRHPYVIIKDELLGASRPATAPAPLSSPMNSAGRPAPLSSPTNNAAPGRPAPLSTPSNGGAPISGSTTGGSVPGVFPKGWEDTAGASVPGFFPQGWEASTPTRPPRSASHGGRVQTAPSAPSWHIRAKQNEVSLGRMRPPRYHVSQLGGSQLVGPAQPPLGATMGHGLLQNGSLKDGFFFPMAPTTSRVTVSRGQGSRLTRQSSEPKLLRHGSEPTTRLAVRPSTGEPSTRRGGGASS